MHTDLSPHLHTDKCNELINSWRRCRSDHPLIKFVGYCNSNYSEMLACLKEERLARRAENMRKSKEWKKKIVERSKELEAKLAAERKQ